MPPTSLPAETAAASPIPPRRGLRRYLTISWVATIVAFTLARLVVARETLGPRGLNIWVFGAIDLATAIPYAVGVAKVVGALLDRKGGSAGRWGLVAAVSFVAPYLYVAWAGTDASFPATVYVVLAVLMVGFGLNATVGVIRKVRAGRAQRLSDFRPSSSMPVD